MDSRSDNPSAADHGWRTHNLTVLSGVSFLQDAASELLYSILPIFLTVTLGAPVAVVGVVEGLAEGAASITKLASGFFGDRFSKRPLIGLGYGLAAVGKVLIAIASGWPPRPARAGTRPVRQGPAGPAPGCTHRGGHPGPAAR